MSDSDDFTDPLDDIYDNTNQPNIDQYLDDDSDSENPNFMNDGINTLNDSNHLTIPDRDAIGSRNAVPIHYEPKPPESSPPLSNLESDGEEDPTAGVRDTISLFNPDDYSHLQVSHEIQNLFDMIGRYHPQTVEIDTILRPFIPDYIPSIDQPDSFLKIPRPDRKQSVLGISVVDEPSTTQSDPTTLELQLRNASKDSRAKETAVRSIENAERNPQKIHAWIENIETVHRQKPPATMEYSNHMPEMEEIMEKWDPKIERFLQLNSDCLPPPHIDLPVVDYAKICLALVDIPYTDETIIESLHLFVKLFEASAAQLGHNKEHEP